MVEAGILRVRPRDARGKRVRGQPRMYAIARLVLGGSAAATGASVGGGGGGCGCGCGRWRRRGRGGRVEVRAGRRGAEHTRESAAGDGGGGGLGGAQELSRRRWRSACVPP